MLNVKFEFSAESGEEVVSVFCFNVLEGVGGGGMRFAFRDVLRGEGV